MKIFFLSVLISCIAFSCTSKKEKTNTSKIDLVKTDSNSTIKPEKIINSYASVDVSPMDMSYFPVDYPKLKMARPDMNPPIARIIYSRPHLQGRRIFHEVLKYGEPWRLGANESTELDLYREVTIQGKKIKAGRYVLYSIPEQDKWTIILNSNIDSWGLHPDPSKDIARFIVTPSQTVNPVEYFTMIFQPTTAGADLMMIWDTIEIRLPFVF
jgi:hypothetical protein